MSNQLRFRKSLLALALSSLAATSSMAAPIQWTVGSGGNDHWYEYVAGPASWSAAFASAASMGGYLATVTSGGENGFVSSTVAGGNLSWLGGSDAAVEGAWRWVNGPEAGNLFTYTNWWGGEPNNCCGGENYLQTNFGAVGKWNDDGPPHQQQLLGYVVEYSSVPEPGSLAMLLGGLGMLGFARRRKNTGA